MIWPTHVLAGIVFFSIFHRLGVINGNSFYLALWLSLSIIGSLLPDIDSNKSFIGKSLKLKTRHRGLMHDLSILLLLIFLVLITKGIIRNTLIALSIGYGSHLFLDALTVKGIPFLSIRIRGGIKTSSMGELIVFIVLLILLILFPL